MYLQIKVLADLEREEARFSIDMQVLTDLKSHPLQKSLAAARNLILQILIQTKKRAGDRPPRYVTSGIFPLILKILKILKILLQT